MPDIDIKDRNNKSVGTVSLSEDIFGIKAKDGVVHNAVVNFLANQRQGNACTKTKGLISGGGKKPWKQKHTGRARAGSSRSPLWRGGGTAFGPQPRDYSYTIPKKARRLALKAALSGKFSDHEVVVIDDLKLEKPNTKEMCSILKGLELSGKTTLIVVPEMNQMVMLSARNIPGVSVRRVSDLNSYDVAVHSMLLFTKQAAALISEASGK
ncbi:MAG: 50S ribosomal protein L4 [Nitrospirae bacterium]|nr:50S ribosomal protein L4 [Nitrospirota bacterium]